MVPKKSTKSSASADAPTSAPVAEQPADAPAPAAVKAKRRSETDLLDLNNPKFELPSVTDKRAATTGPKNYNMGKVAPAKTKKKTQKKKLVSKIPSMSILKSAKKAKKAKK
ncbi:hypothetical protein B9Z55_006233 [Caenorhabditis nigoni]|uniref:Uncharacterized protein n=1 Tax=Caenorhabditis nigoni TaxID=1611254 RepID=A0A2G5V484_9PELO|nr:hypothetical protein B9Z55_006233 [Caenorhabditis nigoni]